MRPLRARKEVSEAQLYDTEQLLVQAQLQLQSAEAQLELLLVGPRVEAVAEAVARLASAEQAVGLAHAHRDLLSLRSPIDGVLDSLSCHPGQALAAGTIIGEVVDARRLNVVAWLPPASAARVKPGQTVRVELPDVPVSQAAEPADNDPEQTASAATEPSAEAPSDASTGPADTHVASESPSREATGPSRQATGKVVSVGRIVDSLTGNLPVRMLLENADQRLAIGQTVSVSIVVAEHTQALVVPSAALIDLGDGPVVVVVREGKAIQLHPAAVSLHGGVDDHLGHGFAKRRAGHHRRRLQLARRDAGADRDGRTSIPRRKPTMSTSQTATANTVATGGGRNLVTWARPYFGLIVLSCAFLTLGGLVAMWRMPSGIYPEVAFPRIVVIVQTPGLAVKDVETAVTRPIEEAVSIVLGTLRVRSKSVRGAAQISVDFDPATDMIQALNDVRARMAEVGSQLPPGTSTIIERQTPSVFPIISFVVTGGHDPAALRDYAYYDLRPRISRIRDVSFVTVQGGDVREIIVEVEPAALVAAGLSIADVADRLGKEHRLKAVGRIDRDTLQYQVLVDSQAIQPAELEYRVISQKNGQPIRLADIGRVTIGHEDRTMAIRSGGENAVALTVFRRLGGNALAVSRELQKVLADAARSAPPGVDIHPVYDQGVLVRTAIANVRDAIIIGGCLSVLVLLAFLKSIRATLVASLAIPLSLVITFGLLYLTGDTLNLMSLGGLAVAIGLIIDDTVVVIENISRHLAEGQSGDAAVDSASREISGAVVGSTLTTVLVFLPLALVRGVVGQFFQSLSVALTLALLVSMVVSLTIIPVLAARYLSQRPCPRRARSTTCWPTATRDCCGWVCAGRASPCWPRC